LRVGWISVRYSGEHASELNYPDEEAYCLVARSLLAGEGLVDEFGFRATYMPVYPGFLAFFGLFTNSLFWTKIAQAFVGALVAPATYLLAERWLWLSGENLRFRGRSEWIARLAGALVAFDPFLVFFSGLLLTETLFASVLVMAWLYILPLCERKVSGQWRHVLIGGVMLWLCVMLRPSAAILVILAPIAMMMFRRFDGLVIGQALLLVLIVLVGLLPWAIRNRVVIGQWCWLTTRGGISLYDGLRMGATGASDLAHTKTMPDVANMSEIQWNDYFRERAWQAAKQDPTRVVRLSWQKFLRTWSLVPNIETYRKGPVAVISAVWMLFLLAAAPLGLWVNRRAVRQWAMLLLPLIAFTVMHMIFVGSIRYRIPLMPMMIILAATGINFIIVRIMSGSDTR